MICFSWCIVVVLCQVCGSPQFFALFWSFTLSNSLLFLLFYFALLNSCTHATEHPGKEWMMGSHHVSQLFALLWCSSLSLSLSLSLFLSHLPLFFVFYFILLNWHRHATEYAEMVEDGNSPMLGTRQAHCWLQQSPQIWESRRHLQLSRSPPLQMTRPWTTAFPPREDPRTLHLLILPARFSSAKQSIYKRTAAVMNTTPRHTFTSY